MKMGIAKPDSRCLRLGCILFLLDNIDEPNMKYLNLKNTRLNSVALKIVQRYEIKEHNGIKEAPYFEGASEYFYLLTIIFSVNILFSVVSL